MEQYYLSYLHDDREGVVSGGRHHEATIATSDFFTNSCWLAQYDPSKSTVTVYSP